MAATDVNTRWQAGMADFLVEAKSRPDEMMHPLSLVFDLNAQLAGAASFRVPGEMMTVQTVGTRINHIGL